MVWSLPMLCFALFCHLCWALAVIQNITIYYNTKYNHITIIFNLHLKEHVMICEDGLINKLRIDYGDGRVTRGSSTKVVISQLGVIIII